MPSVNAALLKTLCFLACSYLYQLNHYSFSCLWRAGALTLDGSLEERLAGFAGCHAVVVTGGHVSTYEAKPLGKSAQGVFASAPTAASGALVRTISSILLKVTAQRWAVYRRGVACCSFPSYASSTALRGIRRDAPGTRPPAAASTLWTAGLSLYVQLWAALPGRHDTCGEKSRKRQDEGMSLNTYLKYRCTVETSAIPGKTCMWTQADMLPGNRTMFFFRVIYPTNTVRRMMWSWFNMVRAKKSAKTKRIMANTNLQFLVKINE